MSINYTLWCYKKLPPKRIIKDCIVNYDIELIHAPDLVAPTKIEGNNLQRWFSELRERARKLKVQRIALKPNPFILNIIIGHYKRLDPYKLGPESRYVQAFDFMREGKRWHMYFYGYMDRRTYNDRLC